ncbi:hypothetical protein EMIHUDRAFT_444427, partial [Emiliania huxleyi CCMP1516]|uniref:Uncharacterized protein n=2 Tax=Emiliania huxleyi TaxID=2903 RepID=A0A0D3JDJ3_EMIH1
READVVWHGEPAWRRQVADGGVRLLPGGRPARAPRAGGGGVAAAAGRSHTRVRPPAARGCARADALPRAARPRRACRRDCGHLLQRQRRVGCVSVGASARAEPAASRSPTPAGGGSGGGGGGGTSGDTGRGDGGCAGIGEATRGAAAGVGAAAGQGGGRGGREPRGRRGGAARARHAVRRREPRLFAGRGAPRGDAACGRLVG